MKHRILPLLVCAVSLFALAFGVTACTDVGEQQHIHEYGAWTVITKATCTQTGEKKRVCLCGDEQTEVIPPLGHDIEICAGKAPTCTEEGYEAYEYCKREGCGYTTYSPLEQVPHVFGSGGKCTVCGTDRDVYELSADGKSYILARSNDETVSELIIPSTFNGKPVTGIGESAFYGFENLKSVTLGNNVTTIGELAFADCFNLEAVNFGDSLEVIEGYAFSQCIKLEEVNLPSGVKSIGECAFVSCVSIEKVTLNEGLESIGDCAFGGCTSLQAFNMPNSVTSIGWGVLMFEVGGEGWFEVGDLTNCLTELVLSNSITEIPDYAFSKSNILKLVISEKVETIRYSAFYGCGMMQSAVIPVSVKKIESYAFYRCSALTSVFYEGSEEEWNEITIGKNGNDISTAPKYFYSETKPEGEGNFWHYENGEPEIW